ncbi:hypothetical protein [Roseovarius gaetbuli]|uniref:hypothetical protein n=1 Tax=Roseovarius gaetbuli TaxID=1356575 RepID=UPI000A26ABAF|nr:hypothetical protein [Roseovarius gaetbuli]
MAHLPDRAAAILVFVLAIGFALSPFATGGFAGFRPDQFPVPQINAPVQPAGYAFALWGLIYLWLIFGAGFGAILRVAASDWRRVRLPLMVSLGIGIFWIPVAQVNVLWATVMIWAMLAGAIWALLRAHYRDRVWLEGPIGLYAGWLTAASSVALGLVLAGYGILGAQAAAIAMIGLALVITLAVLVIRPGTPSYGFGVGWALVGVIMRNLETSNMAVITLCVAGLAAIAIVTWRGARALSRT